MTGGPPGPHTISVEALEKQAPKGAQGQQQSDWGYRRSAEQAALQAFLEQCELS